MNLKITQIVSPTHTKPGKPRKTRNNQEMKNNNSDNKAAIKERKHLDSRWKWEMRGPGG